MTVEDGNVRSHEAVTRENYKRSAPERAAILECVIAHAKKFAVSKSRKVIQVAYLDQISNIGSGRV